MLFFWGNDQQGVFTLLLSIIIIRGLRAYLFNLYSNNFGCYLSLFIMASARLTLGFLLCYRGGLLPLVKRSLLTFIQDSVIRREKGSYVISWFIKKK